MESFERSVSLIGPRNSYSHRTLDESNSNVRQALYYDCLVAETSVDDEDARSQRDAQSSTPSRVLTGEEHVVLQVCPLSAIQDRASAALLLLHVSGQPRTTFGFQGKAGTRPGNLFLTK